MIPERADIGRVIAGCEKDLGAPVAGALPWCDELAALGCSNLFASRHRDHAFTAALEVVSQRLSDVEVGARGAP
jgi:hypothetical protein